MNRENKRAYDRQYYITHKHRKSLYKKKRNKTNIIYKLSGCLRNFLAKYDKSIRIKDLYYSVYALQLHLENMFEQGMSWKNHNVKGWTLEPVKLPKEFDLTDRKQLLLATHYTNMSPVWAKDGYVKRISASRKGQQNALGTGTAVKDSLGRVYPSITLAAKAIGVSRCCIADILRGKQKTTRGLKFTYV